MHNLKLQFLRLEKRRRALITPIVKSRLWEITVPVLWQTTFARTSLVLRIRPKISTLTDNGSVSDGHGFRDSQAINRRLHQLRIRYHLAEVGNRFTTETVANYGDDQLLSGVDNFVEYLVRLDRIMRSHVR